MRRLDLRSPEFTQPQVGLLNAQIQRTFDLLVGYTAELTQEQLEYRGPQGDRNSIASLIAHMTAADVSWLHRVQGKALEGEWLALRTQMITSPLPQITGMSATELLDRYRGVLARMTEHLLTLTDADLDQVVRVNDELETTVRWGLNHIIEHAAMHQGHIVWLKNWQTNH